MLLIDGVEHTPPQVSAEILKAVVRHAHTFLGERVQDVVITVPAWFGDNERAATLEAGQLAGALNVLQLLSEPQAAALAFAAEKVTDILNRAPPGLRFIGGTFDGRSSTPPWSPRRGYRRPARSTRCARRATPTSGDWTGTGRSPIFVAEKVFEAHGVDLRQDAVDDHLLLDSCEKAKRLEPAAEPCHRGGHGGPSGGRSRRPSWRTAPARCCSRRRCCWRASSTRPSGRRASPATRSRSCWRAAPRGCPWSGE